MFAVWNDEDYYGPHLVAYYATLEAAEKASWELNADYRRAVESHGLTPPMDWPTYVEGCPVNE